MVGSPDFIGDFNIVKGKTDTGFVAPMAAGVVAALEHDQASIARYREMYRARLGRLIELLTRHRMRLALEPAAGFFTLWLIPTRAFGKKVQSAEHFNFLMIEQAEWSGSTSRAMCATLSVRTSTPWLKRSKKPSYRRKSPTSRRHRPIAPATTRDIAHDQQRLRARVSRRVTHAPHLCKCLRAWVYAFTWGIVPSSSTGRVWVGVRRARLSPPPESSPPGGRNSAGQSLAPRERGNSSRIGQGFFYFRCVLHAWSQAGNRILMLS